MSYRHEISLRFTGKRGMGTTKKDNHEHNHCEHLNTGALEEHMADQEGH